MHTLITQMDVGDAGKREFSGSIDCILKTAKQSGWGKGTCVCSFKIILNNNNAAETNLPMTDGQSQVRFT